jgi:hypothetical protein
VQELEERRLNGTDALIEHFHARRSSPLDHMGDAACGEAILGAASVGSPARKRNTRATFFRNLVPGRVYSDDGK